MKYIYFLVTFFSFVLFGTLPSTANPLPDKLNDSQQIPVIIRMKNQFDTRSYARTKLSGYAGPVKKEKLISSLKSYHSQSQSSILKSLKTSEANQEISHIRPFWITNIITCKATEAAIEKIRARDDVESISIDQPQKMIEGEPEREIRSGEKSGVAYNIEMTRALEANAYGYTGKGVIVGLIDTGVNPNHEDLKDAMWTTEEYPNHGWNFTANNNNPADDQGHGTHCAGTILGNGKSGTRTGVAPDAKLMALKALDNRGDGKASDLIEAIEFATEHGANVLSMSLGFLDLSNSDKKTWRDTMSNLLEFNILAVIAAGNEGNMSSIYKVPNNLRYPGACPPAWLHPEQTLRGGTCSVITVGAVTKEGSARLALSAIGPVTWQNIETYNDYPYNPGMGLIRPDIAAPGELVPSADYTNPTGYKELSGTSMATPCVAGIVAAMLSKNSELTPAEIVQIISESSVRLSSKFNNQTGAGRADALLATLYTPNPGMNCKKVIINETSGYKNGYLNKDDEANLSFMFDNPENEDISDYQIEIKCLSAGASLTTNEIQLPALKARSQTEITDACHIKILPGVQTGDLIDIAIIIKKGDKIWSNLFRLPISKAVLSKGNLQAKEVQGNGNGKADPGESIELTIPVKSIGTEPCRKVNVSYEADPSYLIFPDAEPVILEEISGEENIKLNCTVNSNIPQWLRAELTLKLKGENIDTTFIYKIPIGQEGILLIDKSKNKLSVQSVMSYLDNKNYYYTQSEKLSSDIDSLKAFHSIWIFAGVYPNANALTEAESEILSQYLENGGYLYMEGGDLWYDYRNTTVNKYFNIEPINYSGGKLKNIIGCKPEYNEDYEAAYTFANISIDQIEPIEPAFAFYKNQSPEYITTVAYAAKTYRTIGSSFELGGILSNNNEESPILNSYLDFFQMVENGHFETGIGETKNSDQLNVECYKSENNLFISLTCPETVSAVTSLYNSNGQLIRQVKNNIPGHSTLSFPIENYQGVYLIKVDAGGQTVTKKVQF